MIELITAGNIDKSVRLPSEMEIAKANGISPMTVRQAYREMVDEGYLYRIQGKGTFVNTVLPGEKKAQLQGESDAKTIEIVVICNTYREAFTFCAQLQMGIESSCDAYDFNIHMVASKGRAIDSKKNRILRMLLDEQSIDGAIIIGPISDSDLALLKRMHVATVLVDHDNQDEHQTRVMAEDDQFIIAATEFIKKAGHERLALLCGPQSTQSNVIRRGDRLEKVLKSSAKKNGLSLSRNAVHHCDITDSKSVAQAVDEILDAKLRPTAIIVDGDGMTHRLLDSIASRGLRVPEDIEILAYADTKDCPHLFALKPLFAMGESAVDTLKRQMTKTPIKNRYIEIPVEFNR